MVVENIFTEGLSDGVIKALEKRIHANVMDMPDKINEFILYKNGKMPWVKLQSSVNHVGDVADEVSIAQRWVLRSLFTNKETSFIEYQERNDLEAYNYTADFGYRPLPGIESCNVTTLQPLGSLRQATINYKCWTKGQLENLERLYMRPGFSCLLEWGWSYYLDDDYNLKTLTDGVDYFDTKQTERDIINKISKIKKDTNYHYDGMIGFVKNFSWKLRSDGGYDCSTTLISKGELISSMTANISSYALDTDQNTTISKLKAADKVKGMFTFQALTNEELSRNNASEDLEEKPTPISGSDGSNKEVNYTSMLNYQYSKSILSGIFYELAAFSDITNKGIGYQKFSASNSIFPKTNPIMVLSMKLKNDYSVDISRKEGSVGNYKFGSDTEKKFIYLKDLIRIINNYAIFHYKQKGNKSIYPIFKILSSTILSKYHPLVISSNYDVCFVKPSPLILSKIADLANSTTPTGTVDPVVSNEIKNFTNYLTADFGAGQRYKIDDYSIKEGKYADSANILINLHYLYSKINDALLQNESDSKKDGGINLSSFISSILSDVSSKLGGLSDLQLIFDDTNGICKIIDRNLLVDIDEKKKQQLDDFSIPIFGERSIVKNVGVESRIFAEQATMISIAAQVGGGTQYGFDSTVMGIYNDGLIDRFFTHKDHKLNLKAKEDIILKQEEQKESEFKNMTQAGAKYVDYFLKNMPDDSKTQRSGVILDDSYLKNMLKFVESRNHSNPTAKNARILPINLGLTFDGISGFLIGNILNLENNVIPEPFSNRIHTEKKGKNQEELYKEYIRDVDYYFAVTGIDHSIGTSGWLTSLKTNYVLRNKDARQGKGNGIQFSLNKQVDSAFQGDIVVMGFGASTLDEAISEALKVGEKLPPTEKVSEPHLKARILYFAELIRDLNLLNTNGKTLSKWDMIVIMGNVYTESAGTFDPLIQQRPVRVPKENPSLWSGAGWGLIQFDSNSVRQPLFGNNGKGINWERRKDLNLSTQEAHNIFDWTITNNGYLEKRRILNQKPTITINDIEEIVKHFKEYHVYDRKTNAESLYKCLEAVPFDRVIKTSNKIFNKYKSRAGDLNFTTDQLAYYTFEIEYLYTLFVNGQYNASLTTSLSTDDNADYDNSFNTILTTITGEQPKNTGKQVKRNLAVINKFERVKNCQRVRALISESYQLDGGKLNFGNL